MNTKEICQICGCESAQWVTRTEPFSYKGSTVEVPEYRVLMCELCEDGVVDPESSKRAEQCLIEFQRQSDHLLLPEQIRAIRKKLKLTQEEMAEICGGGVKAFARYENGIVTQSRAMDNLIRLIDHSRENLDFLRTSSEKKPTVSAEVKLISHAENLLSFPSTKYY